MPESFYCLDNDVILKLATCHLFENTIAIFDINATQIKILDTFRYKFSKQVKRKRGRKADSQPSVYNVERALQVTENYTTISEHDSANIDKDIYIKLKNYNKLSNDSNKKIDNGEALLISHVSYVNKNGGNNYLLTGDKRCLTALTDSDFTDIVEYLDGKIWCFEQLVLKNIEEFGFTLIQNKIYPVRVCDTNIKFIFGFSEIASEDQVKEDLKTSIIRLKQETGNLLHSYPN